jgi:hypothetical protein
MERIGPPAAQKDDVLKGSRVRKSVEVELSLEIAKDIHFRNIKRRKDLSEKPF